MTIESRAAGQWVLGPGGALLLFACSATACSDLLGLGDFTEQGAGGSATTSASGALTTTTTSSSGAPSSASGSGDSSSADTTVDSSSSSSGGGGSNGDGGGGSSGDGGAGSTGGGGSGTGGDLPVIACNPGTYTNADTTECDPLDPNTCPDGTHCSFKDAVGNLGCVANLEGDGVPGDSCVDDADCAGSAHCVGGKCAPFCCPESDEPCDAILGGRCHARLDGDEEGTYIQACRYDEVCEPLEDTCSNPDQNCYLVDFEAYLAICVNSPQNTPEGGACGFVNSCTESAFCNVENVCRQLCDVNDWETSVVPTGGCPSGRTCVALGFDVGSPWEHLGACVPL